MERHLGQLKIYSAIFREKEIPTNFIFVQYLKSSCAFLHIHGFTNPNFKYIFNKKKD